MLSRRESFKAMAGMGLVTGGVCVNIMHEPKARPEKIESLLAWATSVNAYIEIFADGSAEIAMGDDFEIEFYGADLREALTVARRATLADLERGGK